MSTGDRLDLDAIEERAMKFAKAAAVAEHVGGPYGANAAARESAADVPALLAEVERLRALIAAGLAVDTIHLEGGQDIRAAVERGDGPTVMFYRGARFALDEVRRALRGESS